jgi:hypothetical protein
VLLASETSCLCGADVAAPQQDSSALAPHATPPSLVPILDCNLPPTCIPSWLDGRSRVAKLSSTCALLMSGCHRHSVPGLADMPTCRPLTRTRQVFSDAELATLAPLDDEAKEALFRRLWSCKEAFVKVPNPNPNPDPYTLP